MYCPVFVEPNTKPFQRQFFLDILGPGADLPSEALHRRQLTPPTLLRTSPWPKSANFPTL